MMLPMTQEFVSVLDDREEKLNNEIDELLEGIDFQKSLSQEKSPTCIPSTLPEENGFISIQDNEKDRDEEMTSPILFSQEENDSSVMVNSVTDTVKQTVGKEENKQEISTVPVIKPFTCSEEKSPVNNEDPMDTLEEVPDMDIQDTYLSDEQFNEKYPLHTIDQVQQQQMETVPYIMNIDELGMFLDDQEKIGKVIGQQQMEIDNFLLGEVLNGDNNSKGEERKENSSTEGMDIKVEVATAAKQSNKVCSIYFYTFPLM